LQTEKLTRGVRENVESRFATASEQSRQLEIDIEDELKRQEQSRGHYATRFKEAQSLSADIEQLRKELDAVRDRLNFFAAEAGSFGFVRLVTEAQEPDIPTGPGKKKLLAAVVGLALLASLIIPIGIDLLDRRIHSPNDVVTSFGFPAMGWLIEADDADSESFRADQLRRLAGALIREQQRSGLRVFGVCAIQPGGGASTLVRALQSTFSDMGVSSLLVDANAFARGDSGSGLPELDLLDPHYAEIREPALKLASHGRHIKGVNHLGEVLSSFATQHRFILVDVPPLLASSDAELILQGTPGIIGVVEAEAQTNGEVSRAARVLQAINPTTIGVVVNRVRALDGGGYVRDLMTEYLTGEKPKKASWVRELQITVAKLVWAAAHLPKRALQIIQLRRPS